MAQSSDEIIKREIVDELGTHYNNLFLRVFPESSNDDQIPFSTGGLTFGVNGVSYGSCDACWFVKENWFDPLVNKKTNLKPLIALEGTDALNRGSSGNAQYQRFHHALGAVKAGLIGVYYLKNGRYKIQEDLYGMAYYASKVEIGTYLVLDNLTELNELLDSMSDPKKLSSFIETKQDNMNQIFQKKFKEVYGNWEKFAEKRSTIIKDDHIIKYSGRMKRNFTDSSQRAGHIAVGEMYLTKYYFYNKKIYYLWPKMTKEDIEYLDKHKKNDKEWKLLRNEKNIHIITIDDLCNLPLDIKNSFHYIRDEPLKGETLKTYNTNLKKLVDLIKSDQVYINKQF